jgi:hypothetical protein
MRAFLILDEADSLVRDEPRGAIRGESRRSMKCSRRWSATPIPSLARPTRRTCSTRNRGPLPVQGALSADDGRTGCDGVSSRVRDRVSGLCPEAGCFNAGRLQFDLPQGGGVRRVRSCATGLRGERTVGSRRTHGDDLGAARRALKLTRAVRPRPGGLTAQETEAFDEYRLTPDQAWLPPSAGRTLIE